MSPELHLGNWGGRDWAFVYPPIYDELMDEFDRGCELLELAEIDEAEKVFKAVLDRMPDHIDAIHHLAMITSERGDYSKALDLWAQGVRIGRKAFPPEFRPGKDRLPWGILDNRPFLRCLHGYATAIDNEGRTEDALKIYLELLSLNPGDNQGIRGLAVEALLALHRFKRVVSLCSKYRGDMTAETLYGHPLALFRLGESEKATAYLRTALATLPLVGKELTKASHRLPRGARPDLITVGGKDEAYYYWQTSGRYWEEDPQAVEWLRQTMRHQKLPAL